MKSLPRCQGCPVKKNIPSYSQIVPCKYILYYMACDRLFQPHELRVTHCPLRKPSGPAPCSVPFVPFLLLLFSLAFFSCVLFPISFYCTFSQALGLFPLSKLRRGLSVVPWFQRLYSTTKSLTFSDVQWLFCLITDPHHQHLSVCRMYIWPEGCFAPLH